MENDRPAPDFSDFARWLAARQTAVPEFREPTQQLLTAARAARDAVVASQSSRPPVIETLKLLAAAAPDANPLPPELLTPRGFRVGTRLRGAIGRGTLVDLRARQVSPAIDSPGSGQDSLSVERYGAL